MTNNARPLDNLDYTCETYISDDFRGFVAYALYQCWLSSDENDPNADCTASRPITVNDVNELRGYFLDLLETAIVGLWNGDYKPGDGDTEAGTYPLIIDTFDPVTGNDYDENTLCLSWNIRFDADSMMFLLTCDPGDDTALWLNYKAIEDRPNVLKVLNEAHAVVPGSGVTWPKLVELVPLIVEND